MYTKYTQVQYDEVSWPQTEYGGLEPFLSEVHTYASQLTIEGKTTGGAVYGDLPRTWKRIWTDQESAETWRDFTYQKATEYGLTITDYKIGDV